MITDLNHATIWRTTHLIDKPGPELPGIRQIYVGAAATNAPKGWLTDRSPQGDCISNSMYSELSAMWKVWKHGPPSNIIGWCHYRRYFWFGETQLDYADMYHYPSSVDEFQRSLSNYIPKNLDNLANNKTLCVAKPFVFDCSVYDQYCRGHLGQDYLTFFNQVAQDYPHLAPFIQNNYINNKLYACLMFISTWEQFDEFCNLWFDSLTKWLQGRTRLYDGPQNRTPGFLAERLFSVWVTYKHSQGIHLNQLPTVILSDI